MLSHVPGHVIAGSEGTSHIIRYHAAHSDDAVDSSHVSRDCRTDAKLLLSLVPQLGPALSEL